MDEASIYAERNGYSPYPASTDEPRLRAVRAELAEIDLELSRIAPNTIPYSDRPRSVLTARRDELTRRLSSYRIATPPLYDSRADDRRLAELYDRASQLRARQSELRRWLADLDMELRGSHYRSGATHPPSDSVTSHYEQQWAMQDASLRRQLDDLDAQMIRWRRALLEVRGLREAILATRRYVHNVDYRDGLHDAALLRRRRLDGFVSAIDRYDSSRGWKDFYSDIPHASDLHHASRIRTDADIHSSAYGRIVDPIDSISELDARVESATRQIDWLLQRYSASENYNHDWYRFASDAPVFGAASLEETLRMIRNDLVHASRYAVGRRSESAQIEIVGELRELERSEQWLVAAIEQLMKYRESILNRYTPSEVKETSDWAHHRELLQWRYHTERAERVAELDRTTRELEACLAEASRIRRTPRPVAVAHDFHDRDAIVRELRSIDAELSRSSRVQWLRTRAAQLRDELRLVRVPAQVASPLSQTASRWLVRLSGGRLHQVSWSTRTRSGMVMIDSREESQCSVVDRALAVLAVRLAAGELLSRLGKSVPLVIESTRALVDDYAYVNPHHYAEQSSFYHHSVDGRRNHPIAAALRDYATSGRQVLLLTSDQVLADQIHRAGGRVFSLRNERVIHAHRPLWQSQYAAEHYTGPHPHVIGDRIVGEHFVEEQFVGERIVGDVNRHFDTAWQESYSPHEYADAYYDRRARRPAGGYGRTDYGRTDYARDGVVHRDGYYYADTFTTDAPSQMDATVVSRNGSAYSAPAMGELGEISLIRRPENVEPAFFLTVDSQIDQAPSIDSVASARLRGLQVTHITHLMQQDPNRLADALGLSNVDASTIRRWQSECRLVCRVPKLRGFDARVLVGCGVTDPAQLASIHPTDLLQRVEDFLATDQGQKVLLSGSSRELSRITSWIAAANSWGADNRTRYVDGRTVKRSVGRDQRPARSRRDDNSSNGYEDPLGNAEIRYGIRASSREGYPYERSTRRDADDVKEGTTRSVRAEARSRPLSTSSLAQRAVDRAVDGSKKVARALGGEGRARRGESNRNATRRDAAPRRDVVRMDISEDDREPRQPRVSREPRVQREPIHHDRPERDARSEREVRSLKTDRDSRNQVLSNSDHELRFFLQRDSLVVDAPSIGPRMADRLNKIGIHTVDDLIHANAESVARKLNNRRIDGATIVSWQQQATLVCRIPMLRGHDAQLLVAADVTTAEDVAAQDASLLFSKIDPIARSREGKRIIRGGKLPDLAEMVEWIHYAQQNRELVAA